MIQKNFWRIAYLAYPHIRDLFLLIGIMTHSGRQPFVVGRLKENLTKKDLIEYLRKQNYENNILAWIDEGETLSMRQIVDRRYQYHIRLHQDGEIRGHYEIAPEYAPFEHLHCEVFERNKYFWELLKDFLAHNKS